MVRIKKKEVLSLLSGNQLEEVGFNFSSDLLERITEIINYKSVLFQNIFLNWFNEFEINIFTETISLSNTEELKVYGKDIINDLFIQFHTVNNFLIENKLNFINLDKFEIIKKDTAFTVKFQIQFLDKDINYGTETLIRLFKQNKYFTNLNSINIHKKYRELLEAQNKTNELYIYKYNEFSSNFLSLYNLENIKKSSNTVINIFTENKIVNNIIKVSLYSNLYSNNFFFYNIGEETKNLLEYIVKDNSNIFHKDKYNFFDIIYILEKYILQSTIRSVIFFVDRQLTIEESNFFKYLLNMTKLNNIVLVSFGINIGEDIDLKLNDKPKNYFLNNSSLISKKKIDLTEINIPEKNTIKDINYREIVSNIKSINMDIEADVKLVKNLFKNLISSELLELAENLLKKINKNTLFTLFKTAQIYRIRRDYKKLENLLNKLPGKIPEEYEDEYNYLNFFYKDRFESHKVADIFYKKIKNIYYINLANIHLSDRLIKNGNLVDAYRILRDSKEYFKKFEYKLDELETDEQIAKYYRESGDKGKSEFLYKTAFFYAELYKYLLLSASLSLDIGNLFFSMDDFNQSEFWYKKSLYRYKNANNINGVNICEFNLSEIYKINGEWNKSKVLLEKALIHDNKDKREESIAIDCFNIAHLEYLKNNISESIKYCKLAKESFKNKNILNGLIDSILLFYRINFSCLENSDLQNFKNNYLKSCNNDQRSIFILLNDIFNNVKVDETIKKIDSINHLNTKFEMIVFFINRSKNEKSFKLLKKVTALLSKQKRNYFFYEYHYIYFNYFCNINKLTDEDKNLFLEVYYYFLKNGRIISKNIINLKNNLEKNNVLNDLFDNARLVDGYKGWKTPNDFFDSFSNEIQKMLKSDFVYMDVYLDKKVLFQFTNKSDYISIAKEMTALSIKDLSPLNLSTNDIKTMKSKEKLYYSYELTKVIPWKISETLFSILIIGFKNSFYKDIDVFAENKNFFIRYASLFSDFYSKQFSNREKLNFIIGTSKSIENIKKKIIKLSSSNFSILISGESGTGKELIAKALHNLSYRYNKPFVPVNIAAIPESLIEAELFGTRKGAFTGANEDRIGLIESADKGTLFLDEIGELPINLQAKLLRTLDSGEVRRLGENKIRIVDIHILSATNRNLEEMIKKGEFREDLFYRIASLEIKSPSLRERLSDIPLLTEYFFQKYKFPIEDKNEKQHIINYLMKFRYKGNIRELESKIKEIITYYPDYDLNEDKTDSTGNFFSDMGLFELRDNFEKSIIIKSLENNKNSKQLTAKYLKISRMHLSKLIKKHKIV